MVAPLAVGRQGGATGYPDRFLPANTRTPPITMAATPKIGVTMPRSCVVTLRGPTSTSLWLFVYGNPSIATTMTPATMRSTPIQPSGRMNTPQNEITYAAVLMVALQCRERDQSAGTDAIFALASCKRCDAA